MKDKRAIVVLGAGGHAKVVIEALRSTGAEIAVCLDPKAALRGLDVDRVPIRGGDEKAVEFPPATFDVVVGLGASKNTHARRNLFDTYAAKGYAFAAVASASAVVAASAILGKGAQILTRAVVQPGAVIGDNAVVNTGAIIEHDARVGDHAFIGPGVILCGDAAVGAGAFLGAGAIVLPGIKVGAGAIVGAGAVVCADVAPGIKVVGVPARVAA